MRWAWVALASLSVGCALFRTPCPERVEMLRVRLATLAPVAAEVDPWARPTAPAGPVEAGALARVDLAFAPSSATQAVHLDATGTRYLDGAPVALGRSALCDALGPTGDGERPPIRVHAAATARASAVLELLADLHSCQAYTLHVVLARTMPPWVDRLEVTTPLPVDCPVDRAAVEAPPLEDQPARLATALLAAQAGCDCPVADDEVMAAWQTRMLPDTFVTSFAVRPSPSAPAFDVTPDEAWQDAAVRLVASAGPDPLARPLMVWFGNEGSLTPTDDVALPGLP